MDRSNFVRDLAVAAIAGLVLFLVGNLTQNLGRSPLVNWVTIGAYVVVLLTGLNIWRGQWSNQLFWAGTVWVALFPGIQGTPDMSPWWWLIGLVFVALLYLRRAGRILPGLDDLRFPVLLALAFVSLFV